MSFHRQYFAAQRGVSLHTWLAPQLSFCGNMMTPSNGNIFRVTGPLWGEFTDHRWIPLTRASDAELWCFLWSACEQNVNSKQSWRRWFETPLRSLIRHCNELTDVLAMSKGTQYYLCSKLYDGPASPMRSHHSDFERNSNGMRRFLLPPTKWNATKILRAFRVCCVVIFVYLTKLLSTLWLTGLGRNVTWIILHDVYVHCCCCFCLVRFFSSFFVKSMHFGYDLYCFQN